MRGSAGGDRHHGRIVPEHALLSVRPGAERAFEAAFAQAKEIIAGMAGFGRLTLSRCVEQPSTSLLLVEWRRLLHHFYDPLPTVEHFAQVDTA